MTIADRKRAAEQLPPDRIPRDYYNFEHYVSKERMITYWHQVDEVLRRRPDRVLEIGVGNRIVSSILRAFGVATVTADINPDLSPDEVTPIAELDRHFKEGEFPLVICARVLQHLPFDQFEESIRKLRFVTGRHLLLTLPVETLRVYLRLRVTGMGPRTMSIPLPLWLKRALMGSDRGDDELKCQNFWKIGQARETSMASIRKLLAKYFDIEKTYRVPEDMSHAFFILKKN